MRPAALAAALAMSVLPAHVTAQTRPLGTAPPTAGDLRAELGECPADLLRRAWTEMLPLEAAAVETEVLALCTERAEAVSRFLSAQARLDGALAEALAPPSGPDAPAGPQAGAASADDRVERLRGEIDGLRGRIARLEGRPERPETGAALADLRAGLAEAEAELARAEAGARDPGVPGDVPPPVSAARASGASTGADPSAAGAVPAGATPPRPDPPPPAEELPEPAPVDTAAAPPAQWRVIFAARRGDGPWRVRLQATRREAVILPAGPGSAAGDPGSGGDPPVTVWRPVTDPPVTLAVGDPLPGGLTLLAVTPEGVRLGRADAPDSGPGLVRLDTGDPAAPGESGWDGGTVGEGAP